MLQKMVEGRRRMRLYDLDQIKKELSVPYAEGVESIVTDLKNIPNYIEGNFEEVEAIPVEWIEKWGENYDGLGSLLSLAMVRSIIEDWRKENEIDR